MYVRNIWGLDELVASADEINAALIAAEQEDRDRGIEPRPDELTMIATELDPIFEEEIRCSPSTKMY